jgi:hypothetical protein
LTFTPAFAGRLYAEWASDVFDDMDQKVLVSKGHLAGR